MVVGIGDGAILHLMAREMSIWNGPVCPLCGVGYLGSHTCSGGIPNTNLPKQAATACQHCWCGDPGPFNGKPHVSCCMCQTRRVK